MPKWGRLAFVCIPIQEEEKEKGKGKTLIGVSVVCGFGKARGKGGPEKDWQPSVSYTLQPGIKGGGNRENYLELITILLVFYVREMGKRKKRREGGEGGKRFRCYIFPFPL